MNYAGKFLAASPYLRDPNFYKTVLLIIKHDEQGAMGLVLNRMAPIKLKDAWKKVDENHLCEKDDFLKVGGPVEAPLSVLHVEPTMSNIHMLSGIHWSAEKDKVIEIVNYKYEPASFFIGASSWIAGQLENEMERGSWLISPDMTHEEYCDLIFNYHDNLWKKILNAVGRAFLMEMPGINFIPDNVNLN
jgi:putative transcriptional regulator